MFSSSILTIWALTTLLKFALVLLSFRGRYYFFRAFIGFSFVKSVALWWLALSNNVEAYTHFFKWARIAENTLMLLLIFHLASLLFRPLRALPEEVRSTGKYALLFILVCTTANGLWWRNSAPHWIAEHLGINVLVVCLIVTAFYARLLQIPWRTRATWIALGLFTYLVCSQFTATLLPILLAEMTWLAGFALPESHLVILSNQDARKLFRAVMPSIRRRAA